MGRESRNLKFIEKPDISFREKLIDLIEVVVNDINIKKDQNKWINENQDEIKSIIKEQLDIAIKNGEVRDINPEIMSVILVDSLISVLEERKTASSISIPELKKEIINLFWIGLSQKS